MSKMILGLDIGIASCGYSLIDEDERKIVRMGVRCFQGGENPKDGSALAKDRRAKRLSRRVIKRKAQRIRQLKKLFLEGGLIQKDSPSIDASPWALRVAALDRILAGEDLARVLLHIAKRRGFRSGALTPKDDPEAGRASEGMHQLETAFLNLKERGGARTIGEFLAKLPGDQKKRNSSGSYERTIKRSLLEDETKQIFAAQRDLGSAVARESLEKSFNEIAFFQRPLRSSENLVGYCPFEPAEKRAPKSSWSFEYFRLLQTINHIRVYEKRGRERPLTQEERESAIGLALKKEKIPYDTLREELGLPEAARFVGISPADKKAVMPGLPKYHQFRRATKKSPSLWARLVQDRDLIDDIAWIINTEKDEDKMSSRLEELSFESDEIKLLVELRDAGFGGLSLKALRRIIPFLEQGMPYTTACEAAGYSEQVRAPKVNTNELSKLPPVGFMTNPVVKRSMSQARKVVNALIREHGLPDAVCIELARDISRNFSDRKKIEKDQKAAYERNSDAANQFQDTFKRQPRPFELEKWRLWKEQGQRCAYSFRAISPHDLLEPNACQVDHIIPYSRSFDDSWNNRVLVLTAENQNKGDRTPFEYLAGNDENSIRWVEYCEHIDTWFTGISETKRRNLLKVLSGSEEETEWRERHLNDTRYATRAFAQYLKSHLPFPDDGRRHIFQRNGQVTAYLRKRWGLKKDRADDTHHAVDATIVACCTERTLQEVTRYHQQKETLQLRQTDGSKELMPLPWESFRTDVIEMAKSIFVSRAPRRSVLGPAHEDTIRSERIDKDQSRVVVERVQLVNLTLEKLERLFQKERNQRLFSTLRDRLIEFNNDPKKAFTPERPIYMPKNDGTQGPRIRAVTVVTSEKSGVYIGGQGANRRGFASNGSMVRTDFFTKNGKFYLVPVYARDIVMGEFPNQAIEANKPRSEWKRMDETFSFMFSVYPNDYLVVESRDEAVEGYFLSTDSANGSIALRRNGDEKPTRLGVRTVKSIKKYSIDVLGRRHRVKQEQRLYGVANRNRNKSRPTQKS